MLRHPAEEGHQAIACGGVAGDVDRRSEVVPARADVEGRQVLTEREEKSSVAIASNESFSGWTKTFTDPRLCAAIVDRLTFGGHIIETGTQSYRLAATLAQRAG